MAVNYSTATKSARMTSVQQQVDLGAGPGKLVLYTAGKTTTLATFTLADPCGTVTTGVLTFSDQNGGLPGILNTTASGAGVAAEAEVKDSDDTVVITGLTVGTSGTDLILDNTNITVTQNITINSATITHA